MSTNFTNSVEIFTVNENYRINKPPNELLK
jgi:hypothetical protein